MILIELRDIAITFTVKHQSNGRRYLQLNNLCLVRLHMSNRIWVISHDFNICENKLTT